MTTTTRMKKKQSNVFLACNWRIGDEAIYLEE
jgi:hypothetical protein